MTIRNLILCNQVARIKASSKASLQVNWLNIPVFFKQLSRHSWTKAVTLSDLLSRWMNCKWSSNVFFSFYTLAASEFDWLIKKMLLFFTTLYFDTISVHLLSSIWCKSDGNTSTMYAFFFLNVMRIEQFQRIETNWSECDLKIMPKYKYIKRKNHVLFYKRKIITINMRKKQLW